MKITPPCRYLHGWIRSQTLNPSLHALSFLSA